MFCLLLFRRLSLVASESVPELVEGPEPLPLRFGDAFKAYALRGIFAFPR